MRARLNFVEEVAGIAVADTGLSPDSSKAADIQEVLNEATAKRITKILRDDGLVQTLRESSGRRPAILVFAELINLIEDRKVF